MNMPLIQLSLGRIVHFPPTADFTEYKKLDDNYSKWKPDRTY